MWVIESPRTREPSDFGVAPGPAVREELVELADRDGGEAADHVVVIGEVSMR